MSTMLQFLFLFISLQKHVIFLFEQKSMAYFPMNISQIIKFGSVEVKLISCDTQKKKVIKRIFQVKHELNQSDELTVEHLWYLAWPDQSEQMRE